MRPARLLSVGLLFSSLLLAAGCATTRFSEPGPCLKAIKADSKLLVPWLPEKNRAFYLKGLERVYERQDIEVLSAAEQEWNLRAFGIENPLDTSSFGILEGAGFTHLLLIREISNRSESGYAYYTPAELSWENVLYADKPSWHEQGNQSKIEMRLVPLDDVTGAHTVIAETTIGHLAVRDKRGGETYINPTTIESARYKAMVKASKRMLKDCGRD